MGRALRAFTKYFSSDEHPVKRRLSLLILHIGFLLAAFGGSILIRFDFDIAALVQYLRLSFVIPFLLISLFILQLHRQLFGWWRYVSIHDLSRIIRASAESQALFIIYMVLVYRLGAYPRSLYILNFILIVFFIGGGRLFTRFIREHILTAGSRGAKGTVLIGAGEMGQMMVREMRRNPSLWMRPVAFVDDNPEKIGLRFQGIKVTGRIDTLPDVVRKTRADQAVIAIAFPSAGLMSRIMNVCHEAGIVAQVVDGLSTESNGHLRISQIKKVEVEDLLGRQQIDLINSAIEESICGKRVLITGAAGSIGSEICRQMVRFGPESMILFDNSENSLFYLDSALKSQVKDIDVVACLGDVTDDGDLTRVFSSYRPDVVFHAAAYKHVPMAEANPFQVIKNNVLGTWRTINAAKTYGAEQFVLISTDKAVLPENIMGATKRVAELMVHCSSYMPKRSCAVRFGNVLDSAGSVVPIFRRMISEGGPVLVTHPDVERYFMTIPEAVQLVLQAASMHMERDIFVLDMGDPVRIMDLAKNMIILSGLEPGRDIKIEVNGLRPGEKLEELLFSDDEVVESSKHPKIHRISSNCLDSSTVEAGIGHLVSLIIDGDEEAAIRKVAALTDMGAMDAEIEGLSAAEDETDWVKSLPLFDA